MWLLTYILVLLVCFNNCISLSGANNELLSEKLTWPAEYHLKGEEININMGIVETFEMWYSATLNRSRIDYYGGVNKKYYYGETENDTGTLYELHSITTKEAKNELVCYEFAGPNEVKDFLPSTEKFTFTGTKIVSNRTLQIWEWSETFKSSRKIEMQISAYVQDDKHIPVQIVMKGYDLDKGSIDENTITNYYGYESEFDEDYLDLDTDFYDCTEPKNYGKSLKNDLKYIHPGIFTDSDFAFQRFKVHHKKEYGGHEHETRQQIFHRNWKFITEHNKKNLGYEMEVNQFADRTKDELKFLTGTRPSEHVANSTLYFDSLKLASSVYVLPAELDLRLQGLIGSVKNQGNCGSCWAFAITAAVEGALARKYGGRDLDLSEQSLIDCTWGYGNSGCKGGYLSSSLNYIYSYGMPTENAYGAYLMKDGTCRITSMSYVYRISTFGQINPRNINDLKAVLNQYGPFSVSVYAGDNMFYYSSGIYYDTNCQTRTLNHAITVVGYGVRNGETYWIVKNSWGETWGEDGYFLMSTMNNNCLFLDIPHYPIA